MTRSKMVCKTALALAFAVGCSAGNSAPPGGSGGQHSAGGMTASSSTSPLTTVHSGGLPASDGGAGSTSNGGASANTGGISGTATTSGSKTSGGSKAAGGTASGSGGTQSGTAIAKGGTQALGGTASTSATVGSKTAGGTSATSTKASGGALSTGGSQPTGGAASSGGASSTPGGSTHSGPWRVMPLGDSITGTTCYPQLLSKNLIAGGHTNFTFVGTVTNNQSCGSNAPNVKSEGHGGYLVTDLVAGGSHASELQTWVASDNAQIVLMHFGTNDVWGNQRTTAQILAAYTTVVSALRGVNRNVVIFVAQIIPLNPSTCITCDYPKELDAAIPAWAQGSSTTESPIYVVDLHSVFDPASIYVPNSSYTSDGVHPNQTGAQMMADKMYTDLVAKGYF